MKGSEFNSEERLFSPEAGKTLDERETKFAREFGWSFWSLACSKQEDILKDDSASRDLKIQALAFLVKYRHYCNVCGGPPA